MTLDFLQGGELEHLPQFITSLAVGLLIGLERERSPAAKAGLRTFALVSLFGTVAAMLSEEIATPWVLTGGLLVVGLMIIAAYWHEREVNADPGTTTVAAVVVCYGLGAMIWHGHSALAVMLAIVTTLLLYFKAELRGMTQNFSRRDLTSMLQFAVLSFIILPILPDQNFGPYDALNPRQIWLMVVLISGVSLAGYVALRFIGQRYGVALLGIFGGLASSTATTLVYARRSNESEGLGRLAVVVILLANLVVLVRLCIVSAVIAPELLPQLLPVLGSGLALGLAAAAFWWYQLRQQSDVPIPEVSNPTELRTAIGFGLLYAVVLFFAAWLSDIAGSGGLYVVALVSGLTDVDAITLSSLRLFGLGKLPAFDAVTAIGLGIISNIGFKLGLVFFIGGPLLAKRCALGMTLTAAGIGLALLILKS